MSKDSDWDSKLMLHDWPECGPGSLSVEKLYQMFKERFELEQHKEDCWLRDEGDGCTCGRSPESES